MFQNDIPQERTHSDQFTKLKKLKLNESEENFRIKYELANQKISEEEFNENQEMLFSDDIDLQSVGVFFFSQAVSYVTPEIFQRILSFKNSSDLDLIESSINFLCKAVQSKDISQDLLSDSEAVAFLLSILSDCQYSSLKKLAIYAILLFSERFENLLSYFFEQGVFGKCCEIIGDCIKTDNFKDIQLFSNYFNYINLILNRSDTNQCDKLSEIVIPFYQFLIQYHQKSRPLAELTLNSIHFFIKQCSDQGLSNLFNETFLNFILFMQNTSSEISYVLLYQYHIISYHDSSFFIQLLPLFSDFFQSFLNLPKKKEKMISIFLEILRNLAANDDPAILEFLLSQPVLYFLQSSFRNQPYAIIKRAAFVYSYLSVTASDQFNRFLWGNDQEVIPLLINFLDISDPEFIVYCFQFLLCLLSYLEKSDQEALNQCINILLNTDIENTILEVLDSQTNEYLVGMAGKLKEILPTDQI